MLRHIQSITVLAALQCLCLAFGLWVQDRILLETARWYDRHSTGAVSSGKATETIPIADGSIRQAESITRFMPHVRVLTLVWTGGLQLVTLFLLVSRMRTDHSKIHERSRLEFVRQEKDLIRTRNAVIFGLANLAESRDRETGRHLERIALYSTKLASTLRTDPRFRHRVSATMVKTLGISSVLHDIGKVGVPDAILLKPGPLSSEERSTMQKHTVIGSECLQQIERRLGSSNFLHMARQIALHHHEHWNGGGYPNQLSGEAIPLVARIVAVADMYDALSVKRVYKEAYPHHKCVAIIQEAAGKNLDPEIVDVFLSIETEFAAIAKRFADNDLTASWHAGRDQSLPQPAPNEDEKTLIETVLDFEQTIEKALVGVHSHASP